MRLDSRPRSRPFRRLHELHKTYAVPASGAPLFQVTAANLNPWTEAKVDTKNPDRRPLLIIYAGKDNQVPWATRTRPTRRRSATRV
jgi:hypothetical protein